MVIEKLLLKLSLRDALSAQEEGALRGLPGVIKEVPPDKTVIRAGDVLDEAMLLIEGLMCRYKDLKNGRRQISELHVAGDFVDLHGFTLKRLDHNIMTLTSCRIAMVPHARLKRITEEFPHLTRVLWLSTNLDAAIHREWVLSLGRRTALARLAHFFCELHARLGIVGLTDGLSFPMDLTQLDIAECLGLTSIHVNRTLKALREQGLLEVRGGTVEIRDLKGLQQVAEFTDDYLSLERCPR